MSTMFLDDEFVVIDFCSYCKFPVICSLHRKEVSLKLWLALTTSGDSLLLLITIIKAISYVVLFIVAV